MKNIYIVIALCLFGTSVRAQINMIPEDETIKLQPILHATMVIYYEGMVIYTDPYGGKDAFGDVMPPDLILITDIHGDHMNAQTLDEINVHDVKIIVPKAVADELPKDFTNVKVLANGSSLETSGIKIEAIPMYNLPESPDAKHTKGRGNGYILTIGGKRIYISGDTAGIPEMRALKNIDVAFVCMNLPYTMGVEEAADAVLAFKPKVVYPYHYRGQDGLSDVELFKTLVSKDANINVQLMNWYPR